LSATTNDKLLNSSNLPFLYKSTTICSSGENYEGKATTTKLKKNINAKTNLFTFFISERITIKISFYQFFFVTIETKFFNHSKYFYKEIYAKNL
jgi:hypothetical protein